MSGIPGALRSGVTTSARLSPQHTTTPTAVQGLHCPTDRTPEPHSRVSPTVAVRGTAVRRVAPRNAQVPSLRTSREAGGSHAPSADTSAAEREQTVHESVAAL